jgi:putative Holliday junction resolvase
MRVLAVDPGSKRVGLALSDETETLATPLTVLHAGPHLARRIAAAASELEAGRIVVGLPMRLDGSEGLEADAARHLAAEISLQSQLPVELWDERFTTTIAERAARAAGNLAARRRPGGRPARSSHSLRPLVDSHAAAILLQSYLDRTSSR